MVDTGRYGHIGGSGDRDLRHRADRAERTNNPGDPIRAPDPGRECHPCAAGAGCACPLLLGRRGEGSGANQLHVGGPCACPHLVRPRDVRGRVHLALVLRGRQRGGDRRPCAAIEMLCVLLVFSVGQSVVEADRPHISRWGCPDPAESAARARGPEPRYRPFGPVPVFGGGASL